MHTFVENINNLKTFTARLGSEKVGPTLRLDYHFRPQELCFFLHFVIYCI